jgi:hypothetical protein
MFVQGHIVLGAPDATVMAPRLTDVAILKVIASRMNTDAGIRAAKLLKHNGVNAAIQRFYCIAADNRFVRRFLARVFARLHPMRAQVCDLEALCFLVDVLPYCRSRDAVSSRHGEVLEGA